MVSKPKILLIDIETTPNLGYGYGKWDVRLLKIMAYSSIMSVSWRWYGEKKINHASAVSLVRLNDESVEHAMGGLLYRLLNEADIVIAHNGNRFDIPVINALLVRQGITPPSPYKTVDTLRVARRHFKFPGGNSLDEVARYLGIEGKSSVGVKDLWFDCLQGDAKAWKLLQKYNDQDVEVLTNVYERVLPFITNHPNMGDLMQVDGICPKCASENIHPYGSSPRRNGKVIAYRCHDCGGRCNDNTIKRKGGRIVNAA